MIIPRIQSVFYAELDIHVGPIIRYQVPENLITNKTIPPHSASLLSQSPFPSSPRDSGSSSSSLFDLPVTSSLSSPQISRTNGAAIPRSVPYMTPIFDFDLILRFVIPKAELCGRLMVCTTPRHRVVGFPVMLRSKKYERGYIRYNLCFVFKRDADVSCYEPIVRKVSRVLANSEREASFLSSPETSPKIHAILEQLFEDLNSYSETSIRLDHLNSIELKIFPSYPNPPKVEDWHVPIPLINLVKRVKPDWDLTMAKIIPHINGVLHVRKIAETADVDLALARECISHLLLYQCVMMIDIFQFSNIYALCQPVSWLSREGSIEEECGVYCAKYVVEGQPIPPWSKLCWLYARLKPPKTVSEWMEDYEVDNVGIDVRRFLTFGVIKGFVRRVHRYPILLPEAKVKLSMGRKRGKSFTLLSKSTMLSDAATTSDEGTGQGQMGNRRVSEEGTRSDSRRGTNTTSMLTPSPPNALPNSLESDLTDPSAYTPGAPPPSPVANDFRRRSAQFPSGSMTESPIETRAPAPAPASPLTTHPRRRSTQLPLASGMSLALAAGSATSSAFASEAHSSSSKALVPSVRQSRSDSAPAAPPLKSELTLMTSLGTAGGDSLPLQMPPDLQLLLDGSRHTDELCLIYEVSWEQMERYLALAGGGKGNGDLGRVGIWLR